MAFVAAILILVFFVVFRLGSQASAGITLSDPVVWVEDGARGRVLQINGVTEEVTAAVTVGSFGDELSVLPRGRDAVFLNKTSGELGVIGAASLDVDNVGELVDAGTRLSGSDLELHANFDTSVEGYVVATDRILVAEPGAGSLVSIPTEDGLGDRLVNAEGDLVAITTDATRVGVTREAGLFTLATLPEPLDQDDPPPGLARSGLGTFVVDAGRRVVNEVLADGVLGPTTCVAGSLRNCLLYTSPSPRDRG